MRRGVRLIDWIPHAILLFVALALLVAVLATRAHAHDEWANGAPVPAWVKASCCGPADAHHLTPAMVHGPMSAAEADVMLGQHTSSSSQSSILYYVVDGYERPIPAQQALPSQDGDYWIFYRDNMSADGKYHSQSGVYCFFVPMDF